MSDPPMPFRYPMFKEKFHSLKERDIGGVERCRRKRSLRCFCEPRPEFWDVVFQNTLVRLLLFHIVHQPKIRFRLDGVETRIKARACFRLGRIAPWCRGIIKLFASVVDLHLNAGILGMQFEECNGAFAIESQSSSCAGSRKGLR